MVGTGSCPLPDPARLYDATAINVTAPSPPTKDDRIHPGLEERLRTNAAFPMHPRKPTTGLEACRPDVGRASPPAPLVNPSQDSSTPTASEAETEDGEGAQRPGSGGQKGLEEAVD